MNNSRQCTTPAIHSICVWQCMNSGKPLERTAVPHSTVIVGNFIHHMSGGVVAGAVCGVAAAKFFGQPPVDATAVGVLCCASSLLPDIDSPQSRPTELLFGMSGVLAPVFLLQSVGVEQLTPSQIILIALAGYLFVQYIARRLMQRMTVHRGIFHSIPMALVWGAIVYL